MRAVTLNFKNGEISVEDVPTPVVDTRSILVANHHSLISPGTEGYVIAMARKGPVGKARDRPDLARQVIQKALVEGFVSTAKIVRNLVSAPLPLGYSCAGEVIETGRETDQFRPGDRVACAGLGRANHAEHVSVARTMAAKLPDSVSTEEGAFGTLGAIALHGVRLVQPTLGETIAVIGLGLVGQLTIQILVASGCRVLGFDLDGGKVDLAKEFGISAGGIVGTDDVKEIALSHTGGRGVDGVIIAAGSRSSKPVHLAAELCREKGRVVAVGAVKLDLPRRKFFEKEIRLEVSRAHGAGAYDSDYVDRGIDYPLGYVRWTQGRNLAAFIDLLARGAVRVKPLITHRFPLDDAVGGFNLLSNDKKEPYIGILIEYDPRRESSQTIVMREPAAQSPAALNFGVIGSGRWAQAVLLPALTGHAGVRVLATASARGLSVKHVAKRYQADMCTSDYGEIIARQDIGSVLIATRHAEHAAIVAEAMRAGKNVFVEKPLAVNGEQLDDIVQGLSEYSGVLAVGFNRRFAPITVELRKRLEARRQPAVVTFRFIVPRVLKGHESDWVHDPDSGAGRIVGEVCHMIDTVGFLLGSRPARVFASSISGDADGIPNYDNLLANLTYADGSIAQLCYVANSDTSVPRERIEVHWEGSYAVIDNFRSGMISNQRRRKRLRRFFQSKGWEEEIAAFITTLRDGGPPPIDYQSLIDTTRTSFLIHECLQTGLPLEVNGA